MVKGESQIVNAGTVLEIEVESRRADGTNREPECLSVQTT